MAFTKLTSFSKKPGDLPDVPSPSMTPDDIRSMWETPLDELKDNQNGLIDSLTANTGAGSLGAQTTSGGTSTVQAEVNKANNGLSSHKTATTLDHPDKSVVESKLADDSVSRRTIQSGAVGTNELDPSILSQPATLFGQQAEFQQINAQLADIMLNAKYPNAPLVGAKLDGTADDSTALQNLVNSINANGGGTLFIPSGTALFAGESYLDVKENVNVLGAGINTILKSEKGGLTKSHDFIYLKDNASIKNLRLSGSNFLKQSASGSTVPFNKIGITTQGASTGNGIIIDRVGFEKFVYSLTFVFDNHSDVVIKNCYTYGQQLGHYVTMDSTGLITNYNDSANTTSQNSGTQCYCLTNFYNSGSNVSNVKIQDNFALNISDAFSGINGNSMLHRITGNVCIKNTDGYYGGWGIDINGGDQVIATDNIMIGVTKGCHLYGAMNCTVKNNHFEGHQGVWAEDVTKFNDVSDNQIFLKQYTGITDENIGILSEGSQRNKFNGNTIEGNSLASSTGIALRSKGSLYSVGNIVDNNNMADLTNGISSADSNNDGNNVGQNFFNNVSNNYPRSQLFKGLKYLTSISSGAVGSNNLGGQVTLLANTTSILVNFPVAEPDALYRVVFGLENGSVSGLRVTSKTSTGFTFTVDTAPAYDRPINWLIFR